MKSPLKVKVKVSPENINNVIDKVANFLGLILTPGAKEIGLLLEDKVRSRRVLNQVEILLKVKDYVESRGISINTIPLKILVPLLEHGSLEEEEELQDLWAKMLTNMLDSEENFQKHIFPYILSQISIEDYKNLQSLYDDELDYYKCRREIINILEEAKKSGKVIASYNRSPEHKDLEEKISSIEQNGFYLFESDNLQRLGLIRQLPPPIIIPEFETSNEMGSSYISLEARYDSDEYGYRITDLGEAFLNVCKFKE